MILKQEIPTYARVTLALNGLYSYSSSRTAIQ